MFQHSCFFSQFPQQFYSIHYSNIRIIEIEKTTKSESWNQVNKSYTHLSNSRTNNFGSKIVNNNCFNTPAMDLKKTMISVKIGKYLTSYQWACNVTENAKRLSMIGEGKMKAAGLIPASAKETPLSRVHSLVWSLATWQLCSGPVNALAVSEKDLASLKSAALSDLWSELRCNPPGRPVNEERQGLLKSNLLTPTAESAK